MRGKAVQQLLVNLFGVDDTFSGIHEPLSRIDMALDIDRLGEPERQSIGTARMYKKPCLKGTRRSAA